MDHIDNIIKGLCILCQGDIVAKDGYIRVTNSPVNPLNFKREHSCEALRELNWIVSYGNGVHWTYYF